MLSASRLPHSARHSPFTIHPPCSRPPAPSLAASPLILHAFPLILPASSRHPPQPLNPRKPFLSSPPPSCLSRFIAVLPPPSALLLSLPITYHPPRERCRRHGASRHLTLLATRLTSPLHPLFHPSPRILSSKAAPDATLGGATRRSATPCPGRRPRSESRPATPHPPSCTLHARPPPSHRQTIRLYK